MVFIPGRLLDFIPSMRRRRLQDPEDIRTGRVVPAILTRFAQARPPGPLMLTLGQRVKRASAALILVSYFWFNLKIDLLVYALLGAVWLMDRYGERITAARRRLDALFSETHRYLVPRLALVGLGLLLLLLASFIVAGPEPPRGKINLMFGALTGLVFVGPWWRLWRVLRFVFWSFIGLQLSLFVVYSALWIALQTLRYVFGETFGPSLRWLERWDGD